MTESIKARSRSTARALLTRDLHLWFVLWVLVWLVGFALLALMGCTRTIEASQPRACAGVSSASVVTLLRVQQAQPLDEQSQDTWVPVCSAFAVRGGQGAALLVTAAHCVPQELGSELHYYAPNGIGHDRAVLVARDSVHDLAVLEPRAPGALVPLERTGVPNEGAHVLAVSALYNMSSPGVVVAELGQGMWETTQTIVFGWSGSPVLDAHGRVWAVVSKCPAEPIGTSYRCIAGHAYVASLGAL
jgi:hypothetical protein